MVGIIDRKIRSSVCPRCSRVGNNQTTPDKQRRCLPVTCNCRHTGLRSGGMAKAPACPSGKPRRRSFARPRGLVGYTAPGAVGWFEGEFMVLEKVPEKCAHPACTCMAMASDYFCSEDCRTAGLDKGCSCPHSECAGHDHSEIEQKV